MHQKARPSLQKALAYFNVRIAQKKWNKGDRLPTVAQLAREAGVSIATMGIAIGELREKRILDIRRNAGVFFGKAPQRPSLKTAIPRPSKVQVLKEKISLDIVEARLSTSDSLPRYKELAHRYGTSFHTLKKITDILIKEGRLVPHRRGFKINLHIPPKPWRTIVLVHHPRMPNAFNWKFFRTFFQTFFTTLEKECVTRSIRLLGKLFEEYFENHEGINQALGFIIWPHYYSQTVINQLLNNLLPYNKPIFIINYNGPEYSLPTSRYIYLAYLSDQSAGEKLGQYLIDTGHKKICYISIARDYGSQNRFIGLTKACSRLAPGVIKVTGIFPQDDQGDSTQLNPADRDKIADLKNKLAQLKKQIKEIEVTFPDPLSLDEIRSKLNEFIYITESQLVSIPLFRKALSCHKDATAWVCANDYLLIYGANEFCKDEHIRVPKDICLAGFNNMLENFQYNLTSYDFNMQAIACKTLDMILYPPKNKTAQGNPVIEVEGFVVARGSTER